MKSLAITTIILGSLALCTGCVQEKLGKFEPFATPAYSDSERGDLIARNIDWEWKMVQDDVDDVLLLRPVSSMSIWHIR